MTDRAPEHGVSRRALLGTGAGALAGLALGAVGALALHGPSEPPAAAATGAAPVAAAGATQAGVARPGNPPHFALVTVANLDTGELARVLPALGAAILALQSSTPSVTLPDGPGDLTVTVGLGARALAALPGGATLVSTVSLPVFAGDEGLDESALGGDLLLSVNASDPSVLGAVTDHLSALVPGFALLWSQAGFRGSGEDGIARNPFGFHDGITVPRGEEKLAQDVWISEGALSGGTICVIRRFALATTTFAARTLDEQNAVIGRDKLTGAPLSGGSLRDEVDIAVKRDNGDFVIPLDSHVRAAHPSFTGSALMLRRSYSFTDTLPDGNAQHGLLFIAYQKDVRTFALTQQRLDETDALMHFATPTSTAAFAILPGYSPESPLGSSLLA